MTTARTPVPPVNLKDRIAALQQRTNASTHGTEGSSSTVSTGARSLKDKIASFERQGAVPTPRGRFGAGAPPVGDTSTKKKGELYGNRVPELGKPSPVAALAARRRTLSSNSRSLSRPTSPESDATLGNDLTVPPLPSGPLVGRRIASDVLPRSQNTLMEDQKDLSNESTESPSVDAPMTKDSAPPAIVVESDRRISSLEASTSSQEPETLSSVEAANKAIDVVSSEPLKELKDSEETASHSAVEGAEQPRVTSQPNAPSPSTSSSTEKTRPPIQAVKPKSLPLDRSPSSSDSDGYSVADDTTASSDFVPTPSDNISFLVSEPLKVEEPSITVSILSREVGDAASISSKEPPVEEPMRAPNTPAVPASSKVVEVERKTPPSFHAVVHRKVRETGPAEPAPAMLPPSRISLSQPKTPTSTRVRAASVVEPQSPGLGDLADLVFSAALLEEQLSGTPASVKKPSPPPMFNLEPAIPEDREVKTVTSLVGEQKETVNAETSSLHRTVEEHLLQPSPEVVSSPRRGSMPPSRVVTSYEPPTPPRDRSSLQSSSLRVRKQSVSDSYPRNSMFSEYSSEDSAVLVPRPSSPPASSDTSSVRSSSKSWKSPRKSIGRASSWLFRGKNKGGIAVPEEDVPPPPSLLLPHSPATARPLSGPPPSQSSSRRPPSWISISSGHSADAFDAELVSSFPSVPGAMPNGSMMPPHRHQTLPPVPPLPTEYSQSVSRAHTVANSHPTGRQQQRMF